MIIARSCTVSSSTVTTLNEQGRSPALSKLLATAPIMSAIWRTRLKKITLVVLSAEILSSDHCEIRQWHRKLYGCIVWHAHNTVFGSKGLAICKQAVYFLHSTRPSVTWLYSRCWLAACDWVMSALSSVLSTRVGRRRKFGEVFCAECIGQRMTLNWCQR